MRSYHDRPKTWVDKDVREVSDEQGIYLVKTFPDHFAVYGKAGTPAVEGLTPEVEAEMFEFWIESGQDWKETGEAFELSQKKVKAVAKEFGWKEKAESVE